MLNFKRQRELKIKKNPNDSDDTSSTDNSLEINSHVFHIQPFIDYYVLIYDFTKTQTYIFNNSPTKSDVENCTTNTGKKPKKHITFKKEDQNRVDSFITPKFEAILLDEIKWSDLFNVSLVHKIDLVLDLDQTLIYAKDVKTFNYDVKSLKSTDNSSSFMINWEIDDEKYNFMVRLRGYLNHFLKRMKDYCRFFICTLSSYDYPFKIIDFLSESAEITIPRDDIVSKTKENQNTFLTKNLSLFSNKLNKSNTIIIDDSVNYWEDDDLANLIISKKFFAFKDIENNRFQYLIDNNSRSESQLYFDKDAPIYLENESTKKMQWLFIEKYIKRCFKYSIITGKNIVESMSFIRSTIWMNAKINFTYFNWIDDINFLKGITKYLGGETVSDNSATTHFVVSQENVSKIVSKFCNKVYYVNIQWWFHSYFYYKKMNENDEYYKVKISFD